MDEMLARLLAVADDVDTGIFLQFDGEQSGVEFALREIVALQPPLRPQLVGLGEPGWFRQAAGDGRGKQHGGAHQSGGSWWRVCETISGGCQV